MATLTTVGPEAKRYELGEYATIGRDASCTVPIADALVSLRHAELHRTSDGRYRLLDLGSRRGTFRADERVTEVVLEDGDEILVGPQRLRFELGQKSAQPRPAQPGFESRTQSYPHREPTFRPAEAISAQDELRREYERLRAIVELTRRLGTEQRVSEVLRHILAAAFELLGGDRGAISLLESATGSRALRYACGRDGKERFFTLSSSLAAEVLRTSEAIISNDVKSDPRLSRAESLYGQGVRSTMCVPLTHAGELLGVIEIDSLSGTGGFTERDLGVFSAVASQAALALKKSLLASRAQADRFQERLRIERLVRMIPQGVVLLDADLRVVAANEKARKLLRGQCALQAGDALRRIGAHSVSDLLARASCAAVDLPGEAGATLRVSTRSWEREGESLLIIEESTAAQAA